jgi:hypothetical protein
VIIDTWLHSAPLIRLTIISAPTLMVPLIEILIIGIGVAGVYPEGITRLIVFPPNNVIDMFSSVVASASVLVKV